MSDRTGDAVTAAEVRAPIIRWHRTYGHGLRPGTTSDINCPSCKREDDPETAP
jgi:hypothetical protein